MLTAVPPQETEYQCHEAPSPSEPPMTERVVLPPGQMAAGPAEAPIGAVETALTVTVTWAQAVVSHVPCART